MQVDINIKQKIQGKVLNLNTTKQAQVSVKDSSASGFFNSFGENIKSDKVGKLNSNQLNTTTQTYEGNYVKKNTIIFAEAVKTGLQLSEATLILEDKIASQIAGIF